jgi:hypothetical protein
MAMVLVLLAPLIALNVTVAEVVSSVITVTFTAPLTPLVPMADAKADHVA